MKNFFILFFLSFYSCNRNLTNGQFTYYRQASDIICTLLKSNFNPFIDNDSIYVCSSKNNDVKDPEIFNRKYIHANRELNKFKKSININEIARKTDCLKSDNILYCTEGGSNVSMSLELSNFYFFEVNRGYFILYIYCGINCNEANIYTFEIRQGEVLIRWASPFYKS